MCKEMLLHFPGFCKVSVCIFKKIKIFLAESIIDLTKLDKYKPIPILVDYYTYIYNNLDIFRTLYGPHAAPHFVDRSYDYARKSFLDAVKLCRITTFTPKVL
jgi:hypothetical protein